MDQELKFIKKIKPANNGQVKFSLTPDYILLRLQKIAEDNNATYGDQMKALELLGKYMKLWQGDQNVNVNIGKFLEDLTTANTGYDLLAKPSPEDRAEIN